MTYSSVGILALILHLIVNHDVLLQNSSSETIPARQQYRAFLISVAAFFITDLLWGVLYDAQLVQLNYLDTVVYFVAMACSILFWTRFVVGYLDEVNWLGKALLLGGRLIFLFGIVMLGVNLIRTVMFSFDPDGTYHAGEARYVVLITQIGIFFLTGIYALATSAKRKGTMRRRYRTIALSSVSMGIFIAMQTYYPLLPLYTVGCLLSGCVLHSFVLENEKDEYRDDMEKQLRENIRKGNYYDMLTGLPSMTHFFDLADARKEAILESGGCPVLLYMDFSGMKFYNTKHGFSAGDMLLLDFARILVGTFSNENCCRIGADHFAVIAEQEGIEDRLNEIFHEWKNNEGGSSLPVHVGIYVFRNENKHVSIACDRAKLACFELKGAYASCYNYYTQAMNDDIEMRQYIVENLDRAIKEEWVQVYYQPIVRATNGKVCDEEALARWIDPEKGFLSPVDFIPALEDSGLICKMDLYVLDQVLKKMQRQAEAGLYVVPNSINLSRSDFDTCDIVEEIRKRVDEAGISRSKITIEITESVIGSDFEFMKEQISRFRSLGFYVWMDDFGSGYSSLDLLQSLSFDLIKFDMAFMRRLDEGENGKIILTELMQMANYLGVDTVCEGVEMQEQVNFLREIGCSRLQGYYFSKPVPVEDSIEKYRQGTDIGYENPDESGYYDTISRLNLYDLSSIVSEDENDFQNIFNTLPMSIIEMKDGLVHYARSNQSYRDFMERFFGLEMTDKMLDLSNGPDAGGSGFIRVINDCCEHGGRSYFDEKMPDGSMVHGFVRRITQNAVDGRTAAAVAVLSITNPNEGTTYAEIARALASDYYNIYIVDLDTERFIEYSSTVGGEELAMERHGRHFFERARQSVVMRIYEEDRESFLAWFNRENIIRELDERGASTAMYRVIDTGTPICANMKITRMQPGGNRIILGVSIVDAHEPAARQQEKPQ